MATASLTIRDIPKSVLERLRARAALHHRSMQGEILAILEAASVEKRVKLTPLEVLQRARALGIQTPAESAAMVRADRDER